MMMTMIIAPQECQNLEQEEEPGGGEALNPRMQCSLPGGEVRGGSSLDCGREEVGNMEEGTITTRRSELESRSFDPSAAAATATTAVVRSIMDDGKFNAQMAADLLTQWETPSTPPNSLDYLLIGGKRIVRPYFFEFLAHVKKRWDGKTIVDLFADEFRQRPHEYYVQAVVCGRIRVDGKIVSPSYIVHDSQKLSHFVHRHEPPVMAESVTILEEDVDVITVCKPASVPVHACGQYRKNTVVGILQAEHNSIGPLFPVHRLDRLVSGLLILARNVHTANFFRQEIEGGCIQKQYVAKVKGVFPADKVEVNAAVIYDAKEGKSSVKVRIPHVEEEGKVLLTSKEGGTIGVLAEESDAKYKDACTRFQRLSTDGNYSLVRCMPQTGRTHQIRVHLQHLGHPIANDALYLQANVAKRSKLNTSADRAAKDHLSVCAERCPVRASEGESATSSSTICSMKDAGSLYDEVIIPNQVEQRAISKSWTSNLQRPFSGEGRQSSGVVAAAAAEISEFGGTGNKLSADKGKDHSKLATANELSNGREEGRCCLDALSHGSLDASKPEFVIDPMCTHCPNLEPSGYGGDEDGLWLHCVRYASSGWAYECPLPKWAI